MKIAIIHDYIKEYGGAERVLEALHEIWPEVPVFTTVYLPKFLGPHRNRFKNWNIKASLLQYLPFKEKLISPFRIIAPFVFKTFDFSKFDVVIVSATGAYIPNIISQRPKTKDQKPIYTCYCHTPPRYLYGFKTARDWKKNPIFKILGEIANHFLRLVDFKAAQNVDYFIANSKNVAGRIKKFYRRDSVVIYPPVETHLPGAPQAQPHLEGESPRYFLTGGRLARPKNIDLIVKACVKLGVPLKVFGRGFGGYKIKLKAQNSKRKTTTQNLKVEFLGELSDQEKMELMRNAKAYIFASEDEDFGITPVEAMSVGTPVIAYRSGGVVESVIDGKTGLFFDELSINSLVNAIKCFNDLNHSINPENCIKQAQKFSKERFKKEIKKFIEERYARVTGS